MDGARTRQCNPINQETPILGADASAAKVRVPVANVWRAWREEIRPARREKSIPASSPLQCVNTRHVMPPASWKTHAARSLLLQDSLSSSSTANSSLCVCTQAVSRCLSRLASLGSPLETASQALRNANGLQQNELSTPSLPRLPVARPTA